jgi:hypothetical protein
MRHLTLCCVTLTFVAGQAERLRGEKPGGDSGAGVPGAEHGMRGLAGGAAGDAQAVGPDDESLVGELLRRWRELRAQGQDVSAEDLCGGRPDLLERLRHDLRAVEGMEAFLDTGSRETLPPAAHQGADGATLPPRPEARPDGAATSWPVVPGYEILGELGRGGMGVVYRARHLKLNRVVALKMVLAGGHAGPDDLARFLAEAEAVAALQHPHIVQLHDFGEHEGLPFFTLEFVPGGSLADKLRGTPLPPKEAARVVEQLARGVHYAHSKGIVHRDLKPANVLLAEDGTPKVADFGLAKRVEVGTGLTATGAILGTPSYMAPEQAGGHGKRVGPVADVYALGAILYECLTGRPPFKAATMAETLLQVLSEEPASVRQLQPGVAADLETICHRCLQKEGPKRYGSAAELADDLRRFQKGEPILARPVGRLEKVARWARRNPVVAGSLAVVLLVLVVGIVVSAYFAADAARQAEQARAKGADLEQANAGLTQTRDELETTLARSLLGPLGFRSGPLTDPEIEALWQLAENRDERLGFRFVEEAVRGPMTTRQLKARAEPALHAAVGLDPDRRAKVERLLVEWLQDPRLSDEQRTDLALAAVALGDLTQPTAACVARTLTRSMAKTPWDNYTALIELAEGLLAVAARLEPGEAADILTQAMAKTGDSSALFKLRQGLSAVASRLQPKEAAQDADTLTQAMAKTDSLPARVQLAEALSAVAARLEPQEAAQDAAILTQAMAQATNPYALAQLADGLSAVAGRLEPKDAAQAAATLTQAMAKTTSPYALSGLAQGLSAVAARMEPREAGRRCAQAAATITHAMAKTTAPSALAKLAKGLSAVAPRMESREAGRRCAQAAAALTQAMAKRTMASELSELAQALSAVAAQLEPQEAAQAAAILPQVMAKRRDNGGPSGLANALSAVAARLQPHEAAHVTDVLIQTLAKTTDPYALRGLAWDLSEVAAWMEPHEARRLCAQAATTLTQTMAKTTNAGEMRSLAEALSAVVGRMELKEAPRVSAQAAAALTQAMAKTANPGALGELAAGLSAVAARLEPQEAARVWAHAAATLSQAITKTTDPHAVSELCEVLSWVDARLEPQGAAQAADILAQAMTKTSEPNALRYLAEGLSAVAARMEPRESSRVCAQAGAALIQAMAKTTGSDDPCTLAQGLSALASRLQPTEAAQAAAILTQTMAKTADDQALFWLADGLSAVAGRMEPEEAAAALNRAIAKTTDPGALGRLAWRPREAATRLEPREPAQAAATLIQAVAKTAHPDVSRELDKHLQPVLDLPGVDDSKSRVARETVKLAQDLSAVLTGVDRPELSRRWAGVLAMVGPLAGTGQPLVAPATLGPTLQPPPCRLSTPELVELLKQSTCVGLARRVLLDQLQNRYRRPFADQWAFVRFAQEQNLGLDFTSPPKRLVRPSVSGPRPTGATATPP